MKKIVLGIFILGLVLRIFSVYPFNTIIGFDQARDLVHAITIYRDLDVKIIGPTAGNNPNLHHGVLYLYYLVPPLILTNGNPMGAVYFNILINALSVLILGYLSWSLFKSKKVALITSFLVSISYYFISFSGWLSNPSPTLFTVPLFFLGLWKFYEKSNRSLILVAVALGLSIQFELFFIYLIPVAIIFVILFKSTLPKIKYLFFGTIALIMTLSTMIATEIKFNFGGVKAILGAGQLVGEKQSFSDRLVDFVSRYGQTLSTTLFGESYNLGLPILLLFIALSLFYYKKNKNLRQPLGFISLYALSPAFMLILGSHNAPWFLIGLPPAIILVAGFVIGKISNKVLLFASLLLIFWINFTAVLDIRKNGQLILEPDASAILAYQLTALDYTYQSEEKNFTINTVTNPLYVNAIWSYHYEWYGKNKYGYIPTFSGGDQLYPFNSLPKANGQEKYLYLVIDNAGRIPASHIQAAETWANEKGNLIEEKSYGEILVQKRTLIE